MATMFVPFWKMTESWKPVMCSAQVTARSSRVQIRPVRLRGRSTVLPLLVVMTSGLRRVSARTSTSTAASTISRLR